MLTAVIARAFHRIGYDRRSAIVVGVLCGSGLVAGLVWRRYLEFGDPDPLLMACWLIMLVLMIAHVDIRHDARVAAVALAGGAFIEWWGTRAGLWEYFTLARPPLFILLAWPPATLAIERLAWAAGALAPPPGRAWRGVWISVIGGFAVYFTWWLRPGYGHPLTWIAGAAMLGVLVTCRDHRVDVCRFVAGAALGYLLERWGTSRGCWEYWSGGTPPVAAVLAHGFAAIAFLRVVDVLTRPRVRSGARCTSRSRC
jgi:hypothetical protein